MVRVRVSRASRATHQASRTAGGTVTFEPLEAATANQFRDDASATEVAPPVRMDLHPDCRAKRVRAKVADVIREGDVGSAALAATTATLHLLRIDAFGRIASAVDLAESISLACYLADRSCIEHGPVNWQRAA